VEGGKTRMEKLAQVVFSGKEERNPFD